MLSAALCASTLTWLVFRATALLPRRARIRALLGTSEAIVDLAVPVDPERDHLRGPAEAPGHRGRVRRLRVPVLRHGPSRSCASCSPTSATSATSGATCRSPTSTRSADLAAEASEAAGAQGKFWEMHDLLLDHQGDLQPA